MGDMQTSLKIGTANDHWMAQRITRLEQQLREAEAQREEKDRRIAELESELDHATETPRNGCHARDEEIAHLRACLKRLEWHDGREQCPVCGWYDPSSAAGCLYISMVGHAPDCWLAAALKEGA